MPVRVIEDTRTLTDVINELKTEVKDFVRTRVQIFRSEMREKIKSWKLALPLLLGAALLLGTAWLVLTGALIAIIAAAFYPSPFAAFFALIIVGVAYALGAAICGAFAVREMKDKGIMPQRSIKVLKDDAVWLQSEAKTQV